MITHRPTLSLDDLKLKWNSTNFVICFGILFNLLTSNLKLFSPHFMSKIFQKSLIFPILKLQLILSKLTLETYDTVRCKKLYSMNVFVLCTLSLIQNFLRKTLTILVTLNLKMSNLLRGHSNNTFFPTPPV
jgi:hypothetical protein